MNYLKTDQEYVDRYDRITVERCRWSESSITPEIVKKYDKEKRNEEGLARASAAFNNLYVWFMAGERYSKKDEVIARWKAEDEGHDRFYENARGPEDIKCLACGRDLFVINKNLETSLDKPDRVLFMFECTSGHLPRRAFYDNREEWKYIKPLCSKCKYPIDRVDEDTDKMWKSTSTCLACGNVEVCEFEKAATKKEIPDLNYQKDRERFCSDKEGMKYVDWMRTAHELTAILDKQKEKENNKELYDAIAKVKRLKIIELEQLINPVLEEASYVRLNFKNPEITGNVIVSFTVHDVKQGREDRESCQDLQKLLNRMLADTNWRLMSDGVVYRLGMIEGRFKAYEKEEDLLKIFSKKRLLTDQELSRHQKFS
ncbi:MAG: hypothetical protein WC757_03055 [Candidatus Paceibacterota bacterium]|jgi:hypothetical protein